MFRIVIASLTAALLMITPNPSLAADNTRPQLPGAKPAAEPGAPAEPTAKSAKPEPVAAESPAKPDEPKAEPPKPAAIEPTLASAPSAFKPVAIWPGFVNMVLVTNKPQAWRDMDALLRDGKFNPEAKEERPTIDRPPADGTQYAILTIQLTPKKSVSKYDFVVKTLKGDSPCLAMGWKRGDENAIFDPRLWEIKYETGMELLQLVFEVPAGTMDATLISALPQTLPPLPAELKFLGDAPPALVTRPTAEPGAPPVAAAAAAPANQSQLPPANFEQRMDSVDYGSRVAVWASQFDRSEAWVREHTSPSDSEREANHKLVRARMREE